MRDAALERRNDPGRLAQEIGKDAPLPQQVNIPPVIYRANGADPPIFQSRHLLCVPDGRSSLAGTSPSPNAPRICTPRRA
jgi:hypothetical protein